MIVAKRLDGRRRGTGIRGLMSQPTHTERENLMMIVTAKNPDRAKKSTVVDVEHLGGMVGFVDTAGTRTHLYFEDAAERLALIVKLIGQFKASDLGWLGDTTDGADVIRLGRMMSAASIQRAAATPA